MYWIQRIVVCLFLVGTLAATGRTAQAAPVERVVTVEQGESLWNISQRYGRPEGTKELIEYNHLSSSTIYVGQKVRIPPQWPRLLTPYSSKELDIIRSMGRSSNSIVVAPMGTAYSVTNYVQVRLENPAGWSPMSLTPQEFALFSVANQKGLPIPLAHDACSTLYLTGITYCNGRLTINKAASYSLGEVGYYLPSYQYVPVKVNLPELSVDDWHNPNSPWTSNFEISGYYDPIHKEIYSWLWIPQMKQDGTLLIQLFDLSIYKLSEQEMPSHVGVSSLSRDAVDQTNSVNWKAGERIEIVKVFDRYDYVKSDMVSVWKLLRPTWEGTLFRRTDGSVVLSTDNSTSYQGRCTDEEGCYSYFTGPHPPADPKIWYVDPYTFSPHVDYLSLKDVVAPPPTNDEIRRLNMYVQRGAIVVEGLISGTYDQVIGGGVYTYLLLDNGAKVPLSRTFAPSKGTLVRAYIYPGGKSVLALVEFAHPTDPKDSWRMWFFNYQQEKDLKDPYHR